MGGVGAEVFVLPHPNSYMCNFIILSSGFVNLFYIRGFLFSPFTCVFLGLGLPSN